MNTTTLSAVLAAARPSRSLRQIAAATTFAGLLASAASTQGPAGPAMLRPQVHS